MSWKVKNTESWEDISRKDLFKFAGIPTAIVTGLIALALCLSDSSKRTAPSLQNLTDTLSTKDTLLPSDSVKTSLYDILWEENEASFDRCGFQPAY